MESIELIRKFNLVNLKFHFKKKKLNYLDLFGLISLLKFEIQLN